MDRDSVDWKGYIPAITTPFTADGELDLHAWGELLDWMLAERMHGIAITGTTGEWFSVTAEERATLFRTAAEQIDGRITVLGGCNAFTPGEVIEHARAAREHGLDGILLTPPPYVVPNADEVVAFYQTVSDGVDIPICVYNWPRGTRVDLGVEVVERLAEVENVVAIKNSTGDVGSFVDVFFAVKDRLRYFGFPANELGITLLRNQGGEGTIGSGAVLGADHADFFNHVWAGDLEAARRCGARDRILFEGFFDRDFAPRFGSAQALMKAALNLRGLPGGHPRPPLLPLTEEQTELVRGTLAQLGLVPAPV
jgi:4-hydroxy-tetrahydrodipicolinate synthase